MKTSIRKQFVEIQGKSILWHTLTRLQRLEPDRLVVALPAEEMLELPEYGIDTVPGGESRRDSVINALEVLDDLGDDSWIMVHDGVRPCVRSSDILALCEQVAGLDVGGILAVPVVDTLKRVETSGDRSVIAGTVDRNALWAALTPQLFRKGVLSQALQSAGEVTDEASAVEALGYQPLIVEGSRDNIKVTRPEDLALASFYLSQQEVEW